MTTVTCRWCGEAIDPGTGASIASTECDYADLHRDCFVRQALGGANHYHRSCTCFGGDQPPDDPKLSRREAATVAAKLWARSVYDEIIIGENRFPV